jgi:dienelactone hydrolase
MQMAATSSASAALATTFHASGMQAAAQQSSAANGGAGIVVEEVGAYDLERLNQVVTTELAEFSDFEISFPAPKYSVKLYRVTYPSVIPERGNRPTVASGLIAVPELDETTLPVLSYQHGSVFGKTEVPSFADQSAETRLMIANFAGQGYVVIGADYFGKGLSTEANSYIVKASTQQACVDMFFATQAVSAELGFELGPLFVSGWSQGGWSTFAFLERLERLGIPVTAAAVASGPTDLYATVNRWANNWQPIDASYITPLLAIMLHAFEWYYDMPGFTTTAIKPEYQQIASDLFTNAQPYDDIIADFPARLPDMLQEEFMAAIARGEDRFSHMLQESHGYRWRAVTPQRVYSGGSDEVTPAFLGQLPVGYQEVVGGAPATAVDAGEKADHRGIFLYSINDQKAWFDSLI